MDDITLLHELNYASRVYRRIYPAICDRHPALKGKNVKGYGKILKTLVEKGPIGQKELADLLQIRPQSLTNALTRLQKAGYIEKTRSETDRRNQKITITTSGHELSNQLHACRKQAAKQMFGSLNEAQKEELVALLKLVNGDSNV